MLYPIRSYDIIFCISALRTILLQRWKNIENYRAKGIFLNDNYFFVNSVESFVMIFANQIIDLDFRFIISSYFRNVMLQNSDHEYFRLTETSLFIALVLLSLSREITTLLQDKSFEMRTVIILKVICPILLSHHELEVLPSNKVVFPDMFIYDVQCHCILESRSWRHHDWWSYRFKFFNWHIRFQFWNWYHQSCKINVRFVVIFRVTWQFLKLKKPS